MDDHRPTTPLEPTEIHSGTAGALPPGDARAPDGPASAVRNPEPVGPPAARGGRPIDTGGAPNNAAANGYWIRDRAGPSRYVPPASAGGTPRRVHPADTAALALERVFCRLPYGALQKVEVTFVEGRIHLDGRVTSLSVRHEAERAVRDAAGLPVVNRLDLV